jgi:hypothetical protein
MTQHNLEDVEALRLAAIAYAEVHPAHENIDRWKALHAALAKLEPKPEKVYVLSEKPPNKFNDVLRETFDGWTSSKAELENLWEEIRELTAVDAPTAPVQEIYIQKQDPNEAVYKSIFNRTYKGLHISESMKKGYADWWHKNFGDKIMSMNEVK